MCMVLIQCFGCANLAKRHAALNGHVHVPLDAQLALVVECVSTALDELGFAHGAQSHVPLDAQLALVVECVSTALDELGFAHGAQSHVPLDAQLALVVECVATALDELGFARIAHSHVPLDAQLALVVECVATALDELGFARIAIPHTACALEASCNHTIPVQLAFPVDPRANVTHFAELVKRCVFDKHGAGVVIQKRETFPSRNTLHIVVQFHKDPRCGCLVVRGQIDSAPGLEKGLGVNDQHL